ncbi:MAG TPA: GntR family transcriptional regulator [Bryobacteraceae bacterium]|jgi:GntR family transcriptional regulator of vanillate catabolism|nr:GntR family transcriptional regulator [Bryobacteraceae bacterium]
MNPQDSIQIPRAEGESQTLRALAEMRELLIRGEFKPGERIREIPLAARLGVSRTPLRLVLDRLEHEGLLKARPKGGFVARQFSVQDILDVIELRGTLEGMAARLAAERLGGKAELAPVQECLAEIDAVLARQPADVDTVVAYIPRNERFHALLLDLAKSSMVRRSIEQVLVLPFASPNAFVASELNSAEWNDVLLMSQWQHRAIVDAILNRESGRAEALAREHSRMARRSVMKACAEKRIQTMPGGQLVRLPEAG